jgi:hypothetical protein
VRHISKCSPDEVVGYIAKAKNATQNALWSIERAYLPPCKGAPAAFILITCLIDFLGTLYAGRDSNRGTFTAFVSDFMRQQQDGVGYDGEELWESLRNKLVHNYSIWQGKYVLTHGHPELHLRLHSGKARILNLENFFEDVEWAADDYFARVAEETELQDRLVRRTSKLGVIQDVEITSVENTQFPTPSSSAGAEFIRMQLEQSIETYQTQFSLLIQAITVLVLGNVTVAGYALSTQRASILFIGSLFPMMILYVTYRINKLMIPIVYTAVSLEQKYGGPRMDWLASTFLATAVSADAVSILREISAEQDCALRIGRLRTVRMPLIGSGKGLIRAALALATVGQLVAPVVLNLVFQWPLF